MVTLAANFADNIQKIQSVVIAPFKSDVETRTLYGKVYAYSDDQQGITNARVTLELEHAAQTTTDTHGEFQFEIPKSDVGKKVLVSVRAAGFAPFDFPQLDLAPPFNKLPIPLNPLVPPPKQLSDPSASITGVSLPHGSHRSINRFHFDYTFDPPGRRDWYRVGDRLWVELYRDNRLSFFVVAGQETVDGCNGTIVIKSPVSEFDSTNAAIVFSPDQKGAMQIFVPEAGCNPLWLRFRYERTGQWIWLQQMLGIE
jgi:hypothetical protein